MRFLAWDDFVGQDAIPVTALIDEAYQDACKYLPGKVSQLRYDSPEGQLLLKGHRAALKHALSEVFLNGLQANPGEPRIAIRLGQEGNGKGASQIQIEILDNGGGFTPDSAQKATDPFFTTRVVGVGLGLTVSRKIIESHLGKLQILASKPGQPGVVRISLPVQSPPG
jgi:signal transduction histidine kinase